MRTIFPCLIVLATPVLALAQNAAAPQTPLTRHYRAGEALTYRMQGTNDAWHYDLEAKGTVNQDSGGSFFEEYRWSGMQSDGKPYTLSPASSALTQRLSLDPNRNPEMPNLSQVDPKLIGPITDLMTVYVDLWLAIKTGQLKHAGDHFYFPKGGPNSWADGNYVLVGEDAIDFDMTLKSVNDGDHTAVLLVRHVPPAHPGIKVPAEWMHAPVGDTPNNWVQISKTGDGKFLGAVGKETFDVEVKVSLQDGKILSGTIDNPVQTIQRQCEDAALTKCGDATTQSTHRKIEIVLVP